MSKSIFKQDLEMRGDLEVKGTLTYDDIAVNEVDERTLGTLTVEDSLTVEGTSELEGTTTITGALILSLPTSDPEVVGQLWLDDGVLTISAGEV